MHTAEHHGSGQEHTLHEDHEQNEAVHDDEPGKFRVNLQTLPVWGWGWMWWGVWGWGGERVYSEPADLACVVMSCG